MVDIALIRSIGMIIVAGALFALLGRPLRMPSIVSYMAAGVLIGPVTGLVTLNDTLDLVSHVGIALLLFIVGLELNFSKVRDVGRVAIAAGLGQVLFTALGGYLIARLLGFATVQGVFIAIALTFSSTVVVVKLLGEKGDLSSPYGRISIGIFLVQDIIAIVLLTFLSGFGTQGETTPLTIAIGILTAFGGMALLLLFALAVARFLLPPLFSWASSSPETIFIASLAWCFMLVMGAEFLHLSREVGAFLAGISLAQLPYNQELHRRVHPLMNFFVAVFFVSLGIKMEVDPASVNWLAAAVISLFVIVGKPFILMFIITRMGYSLRTSFSSSLAVAQISEFSFIVITLALSSGLVTDEVLSITALIGFFTFAISSYMIIYNDRLFEIAKSSGILRIFGKHELEDERDTPPAERAGHVIVVGMNTLGREIVQRLVDRGETVLAIDRDNARIAGLPCETMLGSVEHLSLLEEAGLPHAKLVVSAMSTEEANDLLAYRCASLGIPCSIHAVDLSVIDNLLSVNTTYLMIPKVDGIKLQTRKLKELGFLRQ